MATTAENKKGSIFLWEGVDRKGRKVSGEISAAGLALVNAMLRRQGINPTKVRKRPKALFSSKKKITPKDVAIFTRQLSTMIAAGIPVVQAFDIVGKGHDNPSMRELLASIRGDIETGTTMTQALGKHPLYFDELYCNLVGAGEQAGILDTLLEKIATYKEKTEAIKGKIKSALFYPTAIIVVAFIITAILLIFVIPEFQSLFKSFGAALPSLTQMIVNLSQDFRKWWWAIFGGIGLSIWGFIYTYKRSPKMHYAMDRMSLQLPIFGIVIRKATIARFARTLATMFAAGMPLIDALDSVAGAAGNRLYYDGIMAMKGDISTGMQLQSAMSNTNLFPNMVIQMVAIGEESGELDTMLGKVADFYEGEVDDAVEALSSLMEPIIMVVLGVIVGTLVIAMYLPIFRMASAV
ncbi:MAG TPA: type II secretion system F family protein [Acidiferrobacteraceae bacterium]|nr:type II secretion system F family protein [Acidiferrobacteraceae bacterium]